MLIFSVNEEWRMKNPQNMSFRAWPGINGNKLTKDFKKVFFDFLLKLTEKYPNIKSVYYLKNNGKADIVTWEFELAYWVETITEKLLGKTFEINPKSFFQTNSLGAEKLYWEVLKLIWHKKGKTALDLYAGTWTIWILLSEKFNKVFSVELVREASLDGERNAKLNWVKNIEFINAKVEEFLEEFKKIHKEVDLLIIDPPRDGMHPDALPNIVAFNSQIIIYVSCNPSTLARDLDYMVKNSQYKITDVIPVDMFPHTHHIETVVRLER